MKFPESIRKLASPILWVNLLAMAVVVAAAVFALFKYLDGYTRHGEEITVPSLKGMTCAQAGKALADAGLGCVVADSGYVGNLSPGVVLDQSVAPGERVKRGREVGLTVNASSPPTIEMPDLADNSSLREAQSRLEALGFALAPPEYVDGEREWVYGVKNAGGEVSAGTRVAAGTRLTLVVGNGMTSEYSVREDSVTGEWYYEEEADFDDAIYYGDSIVE